MKTPTIGLVGCGYWGPNLLRNFHALGDCHMKTICDVRPDRLNHLQALYPGLEATTNYAELLADREIDVIAIATPVHLHHGLAKAALEAGKHVFIEKPMASSSEECEDLLDTARAQGLIIMIGHTFLYSAAVRKIKEIIDNGDIGDLQYISSRRLNLGLFQKDINVVWDLAPHDISIVLYLMEDVPVSVNCQGTANITRGIEDVSNLSLNFKRRGFATIQNSWLDPKKVREMTIVGSKRMIVYDDVEPLQKLRIYDTHVERPPFYDSFAEWQYSYHPGDMYVPRLQLEEPLKVECQHLIDCVREGTLPISCGEQGLDLVRILEASSASLQQGGSEISTGTPPGRNQAIRPLAPLIAVEEPVGGDNGNGAHRKNGTPKGGRVAAARTGSNGGNGKKGAGRVTKSRASQ